LAEVVKPAAPERLRSPEVEAAPRERRDRWTVSARIGFADHLQLKVLGPAIGAAFDYAPTQGLVIGVSVDYSVVGASYRVSIGSPGSGDGILQTRIWLVPIFANLIYQVAIGSGGIRLYGGAGVGVVVAGVSNVGRDTTTASIAFAPIAGVDVRLGPGRFALEGRVLLSGGGVIPNVAKELQLGGLFVQACYRYAF
jgi:opacity protein-like surface antigen